MVILFMVKLLTILLTKKNKSIQYNVALAITGTIRGLLREKKFPITRFVNTSAKTLV